MTALVFFSALILQVFTLKVIRNGNSLSGNPINLLAGSFLFFASIVLLVFDYGALAGIIIAIALLSMLGITYPLLKR